MRWFKIYKNYLSDFFFFVFLVMLILEHMFFFFFLRIRVNEKNRLWVYGVYRRISTNTSMGKI